ncbi:MAG: DUF167 domain-containing protein [Phycisphaeraceae bacterium]|nr:DUF167 domain-containing protein [Phycisphaeraceae bacterium]
MAILRVKVVPGAKRDEIVGPLGDRLKVRVSAPPEDGKANRAVCELVAHRLGVHEATVRVASGHTNSHKTLEVEGVEQTAVDALLG